uniref:Leukocyte-associated immunoglobulin-like receptor 1 n=1 Tax=Cricetulus griseus TaxID=10029 RepID=A0A8C2LYY9_CRIGR
FSVFLTGSFLSVLCLGQTVDTVKGYLPTPSISAEPGLSIPLGHNVTFVCSNSSGYDLFRLERNNMQVKDEKNTLHSMTEARFHLGPVDESFAGRYSCVYVKESIWSLRSETLELMVTREDVTQAPDPGPAVTSDTSWLKTNGIYILIGVSVVFLLCLLLLLLFCFHSHRQKKQGRCLDLSYVFFSIDIVTDDRLLEDRRTETQVPVSGSLQEVTYAQLDHHALTQRTAEAVTPWSTDAKPESSTYAAIIRR